MVLKEPHWLILTSLSGGLTPPLFFATMAPVDVVLQL